MSILITALIFTVGGFWLQRKYRYEDYDIAFGIAGMLGAIVLAVSIITIPIHKMNTMMGIQKFEMTKETFEQSRKNPSDIERYARLDEVIKANGWLVSTKYYNETLFDIWIPDEIESIEPIKTSN